MMFSLRTETVIFCISMIFIYHKLHRLSLYLKISKLYLNSTTISYGKIYSQSDLSDDVLNQMGVRL